MCTHPHGIRRNDECLKEQVAKENIKEEHEDEEFG
jgi:hypothetical protein